MNDSPSYASDVQNSGRILEFDTKTPGKSRMIEITGKKICLFHKCITSWSIRLKSFFLVISKLTTAQILATDFSPWGALLTDECPQDQNSYPNSL